MMPSCLSILFRALRIEWRETKRTLFPPTLIETGLFLFFFILYGYIGYRMLFHTELIDVPNGGAGSYLGYDNLFHLHTRGGAFDISHPFFGIFHLLKTLLMNLLITGGLVLIYRYLKQIVRISSRRALLLTGFTGCFFTTVVLSFTTESYPFSFFLLVFSLLMLSREYKLTGYIKGRTILFLSFLCGGITITNAAKPAMALFLNKAPFWRKIRTGIKVMLPFVICVAVIMGFYTLKAKLFNPEGPSPIETTGQLGQYFIHDETFGKQALVDFWGNTIISTPLTQQLVGKEVVLRPSEYLHSWNNAVIMFLLFLVTASALLNLKNKYVQLLLMYLSIDFVIHFIIRYGMNEAILFGGHWMFAVPILLGWLYTRLPVRMYRILDWIIIGFFVLTATINTMEFMRSFLFA